MTQLIFRQEGREEVLQVVKDIFSIGRTRDNDLVIRGDGISRRHCEIRKKEDNYVLIDLGSRNGTYVNGTRVTEQRLSLGDRIGVGSAEIIFEKEIPRHEEAIAQQASRTDNFVVPTRESHFSTVLFVALVVAGIIGIVLWRLFAPTAVVTVTENLLAAEGSFEEATANPTILPDGWKTKTDDGTRVLITSDEKHTGKFALLIDRSAGSEFLTECSSEKVPLPAGTSSVTFGGWLKSNAFNKCGALFKLLWFREGQTQPILETATDLTVPRDQWQEVTVTVPVPMALQINPASALGGYAVAVSAQMIGNGNKIYFDDIEIIPSSAAAPYTEEFFFLKETKEIQLSGYYNGTWSLFGKDKRMLLSGGTLLVKNEKQEIGQIISAPAVLPVPLPSGEGKGLGARQIFFPVQSGESEWLQYESNFSAGLDEATVAYNIPLQKLFSKLNGICLRYSLPAGLLAKTFKIRGTAFKEVSTREAVTENNVSQLEFTMGGKVLTVKYPNPLDIIVQPRGNELEIRQGLFRREQLIRYSEVHQDGLPLQIVFGWKPAVKESTGALDELWAKGKELEAANRFGEAMGCYSEILGSAQKENPVRQRANEALRQIRQTAAFLMTNINFTVSEAEITGEEDSFDRAEQDCKRVLVNYKGTEYATDAELLLAKIKELRTNRQTASQENELKRLLNLAEGYLKEEKWGLSKLFAEQIVNLDADSPQATRAREILETVKKNSPEQ